MTRATSAGKTSANAGSRAGSGASTTYLKQSERPWASLLFVLPLVILYELGTQRFAIDPIHQTEQRIIAFNLMQQFFGWFGASGRYLPALAVVGILLAWHIARNDPWRVRGWTLAGMAVESCALGVPLMAVWFLSARYLPLLSPFFHQTDPVAAMATDAQTHRLLVLSLGAGVYEELVFRLIAFTLLTLVLVDLLKLPKVWCCLPIVFISALVFALYHYWGSEAFEWRSFAFRTFAGIYFGLIFLTRGFGITAGAHAAYDVIVHLYAALR
ncbi:MAG: CPBP family intramembrane glutamic endopeptidase [Tepidisphaeraceae bacterium]